MYDVSVEPEEPLLIEPFIEVITGATGATVLKLYSFLDYDFFTF
jgi:hypothetical protein